MIHLLLQKFIHKKWMMLSLLLGNILLVSIAAAYPMFRDASLGRMLVDEFANYSGNSKVGPDVIEIVGKTRKRSDISGYEWAQEKSKSILQELNLSGQEVLVHHYLQSSIGILRSDRGEESINNTYMLGSMEKLPENCNVISGSMYKSGLENGVIEAVVTVKGFVNLNLLIGDEIEFQYMKYPDDSPIRMKVVGVIEPMQGHEDYWIKSPDEYQIELFIDEDTYKELFLANSLFFEQNTARFHRFDYEKFDYKNAKKLKDNTESLIENAPKNVTIEKPAYLEFLGKYLENEKKVETTLIILQVPVLVLLCAFIYMISGQIYSMEQNEIALLKSRGASNSQVFKLYLLQGTIMAVTGGILGFPLGSLICRALGSASAFLEFAQRRVLGVKFSISVLIYMAVAMIIAILLSVIPSLFYSKNTIVGAKASKAVKKRPLWQKLFIDVILLGVSLYGFYSFGRQKEQLEIQVLQGEALDPLLYLSSSLFILGAALLMLRIIPLIANIIYMAGKKKWKPAFYASFQEISRSGSSRYFIMTFLILTVSLGVFNTTVARTIASNSERNFEYLNGCDISLVEKWPNNSLTVQVNPDIPLVYHEPDFAKYEMIDGVKDAARVYVYKKGKVDNLLTTVMGISTKEFGEVTSLPKRLLDKHLYTYLNEMSTDDGFVLVSSNYRDNFGYKIGDKISYRIEESTITGVIADFVDYFPGYDTQGVEFRADGSVRIEDKYLIVAHLQTIQRTVGMRPYQVWLKLEEGAKTQCVYDYINENDVQISKFTDLSKQIDDVKSDTLFQGTNGILTLSFMVILIICIIGYLIYWTLTISSRELLLGVLRAMGMSQKEVLVMLINEQVFSSILPLVCGAGIGFLASRLYVPLIQIAYSANNQVLPLVLVTKPEDLIRLFVIITIMILICFAILARQISRMKIAQALKLGED